MSTLEIDMAVTKMVIGRTDKDDREETSGLKTKLDFEVVGSPRSLARMANLLKQGNVNINLIIRATNAATDMKVESIELPHQVSLEEGLKNAQEAARMPPVIDTLKAGNTPIRTGDPIVSAPVSVLGGDKPEPEPASVPCTSCGYMASAEELKCPVCGLEMSKGEPAISGNGHEDAAALAATATLAEANEMFDEMGDQRDQMEAEDAAIAGSDDKPVKRTRKNKGG